MICFVRDRLLSVTDLFAALLTVALLTVGSGCADSPLSSAPEKTVETSSTAGPLSSSESRPHTVLTRSGARALLQGHDGKHGPQRPTGGSFATPLFGLDTAPNGDILVADAGAGISTLSGATDIPLPGVSDMSPLGRGAMWAIEGLTGDPGMDTGQALYRASRGNTRMIADLYAFEKSQNPDGAELIDSNPFDVQSLGGSAALVADAGGNDLLRIDNQGHIDVLAVLPDASTSTANLKSLIGCPEGPPGICELPPMLSTQPVPTSIAVGPDGSYYAGELKGFPAPTGASNVWKIAPDASGEKCPSSKCEKVFNGGFTSIIDLRFDERGTLYVVELDENSWFAVELGPPLLAGGTINACDLDTGTCREVATGIPIVTAVTFGTDGTLWATKYALRPDKADVIKVR